MTICNSHRREHGTESYDECPHCAAEEAVAAIVAMLRKRADARFDKFDAGSGERCLREAADAIERGEHLKGGKYPPPRGGGDSLDDMVPGMKGEKVMATRKEQRTQLEAELTATEMDPYTNEIDPAPVRAALARLDAAERVASLVSGARTQFWSRDRIRDLNESCDAYDALVREQDGGEP